MGRPKKLATSPTRMLEQATLKKTMKAGLVRRGLRTREMPKKLAAKKDQQGQEGPGRIRKTENQATLKKPSKRKAPKSAKDPKNRGGLKKPREDPARRDEGKNHQDDAAGKTRGALDGLFRRGRQPFWGEDAQTCEEVPPQDQKRSQARGPVGSHGVGAGKHQEPQHGHARAHADDPHP